MFCIAFYISEFSTLMMGYQLAAQTGYFAHFRHCHFVFIYVCSFETLDFLGRAIYYEYLLLIVSLYNAYIFLLI